MSLGEHGEGKQPRQLHHTQLPFRWQKRFNDARSWSVTPRSFRPCNWPCRVPVRGLDRRSSTKFVPDLAMEIDRADEALAKAPADEITHTSSAATVAACPLENVTATKWRILQSPEKRALPPWCGTLGETSPPLPECEARPMPRARSAAALPCTCVGSFSCVPRSCGANLVESETLIERR